MTLAYRHAKYISVRYLRANSLDPASKPDQLLDAYIFPAFEYTLSLPVGIMGLIFKSPLYAAAPKIRSDIVSLYRLIIAVILVPHRY